MKNIWENPEIQCLNRLPMRSPLFPYPDAESARAEMLAGPENSAFTKSPFVKSLDGKWKFTLIKNPEADLNAELAGWTTQNFSDSSWSEIQVPGTWTLQGFDKPHYTNVQMPFDIQVPNVCEQNPTGLYRLNVFIPAEWKNRRIVLHVGSAESCIEVFVNGKNAGVSKDTRLPCEFEISPYIEWTGSSASAVIAFKVIRYSDASFVEDQDQWWFGGIHRSVYLYSTENTFIADVQAVSTVKDISSDGKTGSGLVPLEVTLGYSDFLQEVTRSENAQLDELERTVTFSIQKLEGNPNNLKITETVAAGKKKITLNLRQNLFQFRENLEIPEVSLWSTENPALYGLTISIFEGKRHIESTAFTIGFKSTEVKNRELLFNSKMIYIHGVNRHEHNPYHGKTLSVQEMVKDIRLMKSYNFNAVRTCHYPDDERWYDLCDRYGLYVLDEANIENHAYYDVLARNDEWTYAYMARVQRMFRRDKNHACIFGWSLGNESGDGQNQVACAAWLRRMDSTRIIHYEGFVRPEWKQLDFTLDSLARGKGLTDIVAPMYPSIELITEYAQKCEDYRPLIMCEYSHAMGNANGSLADYWKAIENTHGLQGGFIWDWIDQGIASDAHISPEAQKVEEEYLAKHPHGKGGVYYKYGSDFGDFPSDYDFCLNGLNLPNQTPKPAMEECRRLFAPVRLQKTSSCFEIENRFSFTDLSVLQIKWTLLSNGKETACGTEKLEAAPGFKAVLTSSSLTSALKKTEKSGEEVYLKVEYFYDCDFCFAQKGMLCSYDGILISEADGTQIYEETGGMSQCSMDFVCDLWKKAKPELFYAILENDGIKAEIPMVRADGNLRSFAKKPAWTWLKKDFANLIVEDSAIFCKDDCFAPNWKKEKLADFSVKKQECTLPNGCKAMQIEYVFNLLDTVSEYPRLGITIPLPVEFSSARWYGNGPHECYSDRCFSALKGMYEMPLEELEVEYIVPQENGGRCGVKYLELKQGSGSDGKILHIQSLEDFAFTVSKYSIKNQLECRHLGELQDLTKGANPHWNLTVDVAHRGVGTGACGPDTLEQYRVRPGLYKLSLIVW